MCETAPYYFNWMLFFHRYLHDDSFTPEEEDRKKAAEMEEYVLANRTSKKEWGLLQQELQAKGFRRMTDVEFSEYVSDFVVFLCSGVYRDACRVISDGIYDIPKYHMIASDV